MSQASIQNPLGPTFCGMRSQPPINPTSHDERLSSSLDIFLLIRAQIKRQFRRRQWVTRERVAAGAEIERERDFILIDTTLADLFTGQILSPGPKLEVAMSPCETCHIYHQNAATDELFKRRQ